MKRVLLSFVVLLFMSFTLIDGNNQYYDDKTITPISVITTTCGWDDIPITH